MPIYISHPLAKPYMCERNKHLYLYVINTRGFCSIKKFVYVCKNAKVPLHTCGGRMTTSGDSPDCWPCLRRQGFFTSYSRLACPTNFWRLSCLHFPLATVSTGIWTQALPLAQQDSYPLSHLFSSGFFCFFLCLVLFIFWDMVSYGEKVTTNILCS